MAGLERAAHDIGEAAVADNVVTIVSEHQPVNRRLVLNLPLHVAKSVLDRQRRIKLGRALRLPRLKVLTIHLAIGQDARAHIGGRTSEYQTFCYQAICFFKWFVKGDH